MKISNTNKDLQPASSKAAETVYGPKLRLVMATDVNVMKSKAIKTNT